MMFCTLDFRPFVLEKTHKRAEKTTYTTDENYYLSGFLAFFITIQRRHFPSYLACQANN